MDVATLDTAFPHQTPRLLLSLFYCGYYLRAASDQSKILYGGFWKSYAGAEAKLQSLFFATKLYMARYLNLFPHLLLPVTSCIARPPCHRKCSWGTSPTICSCSQQNSHGCFPPRANRILAVAAKTRVQFNPSGGRLLFQSDH